MKKLSEEAVRALLRRRARRGAVILDHLCPGWERKLGLKTLDMISGGCCALGQIYGSYERAMQQLGWSRKQQEQCGFAIFLEHCQGDQVTWYVYLTEAWREEALARRRKKTRVTAHAMAV